MRTIFVLVVVLTCASAAHSQDSLRWYLRTSIAPAFNGSGDYIGVRMVQDLGHNLSRNSVTYLRFGVFATNGDVIFPITSQLKTVSWRYALSFGAKRTRLGLSAGPGVFFGKQLSPYAIGYRVVCDPDCRNPSVVPTEDEGIGWFAEPGPHR